MQLQPTPISLGAHFGKQANGSGWREMPGSSNAENVFGIFAAHDAGWVGLAFGKLVQR
jgi:hypothetical protein